MVELLICLAVMLIALSLLLRKDPSCTPKISLLLTEKIYAVPGMECNIYFNNIVTVINYKNYVFEVISPLGRTDAERWRLIPEEKDAGEHKITIRVHDENGVVAEGSTLLCVTPIPPGDCALSLLLMGDSQTGAVGYPEHIFERMACCKNISFHMTGSRTGNDDAPPAAAAAREGYGGWGWNTFFTNFGVEESGANDGLHPDRPKLRNSPFLFPEGNSFKFDLVQYFDKYAQGKVPDTLIVMLGINNVFCAKSNDEIDRIWDREIYPYMKQLVEEFRKLSPAIHIAFCTLTPGAFSQDAFGHCYRCSYNLWQWRKNHLYYHKKLFKAAKELNVPLIPVHTAVDGANGFPETVETVSQSSDKTVVRQSNAVHPDASGYRQIGDCIFSYLIYHLNSR